MNTYITPVRYNNVTGLESRWASIRQPYLFELQRRDGQYTATGTDPNTGNMVLVGSNPQFADRFINIGEVFTAVNAIGEKRLFTVTGVFGNNGGVGSFIIYTDQPAGNGFSGGPGWVNWAAYENFQYELILTGDLADGRTGVPLGSVIGTPDSFGKAVIDVKDCLAKVMDNQNLYQWFGPSKNSPDSNGYIRFYVSYVDRYVYLGVMTTTTRNPEPITSPLKELDWYGINGVKTLLSTYGQNFADYLPNPVEYPAKWLTAFKVPTLFIGYPFSLSFIYNRDLFPHTPELVEDQLIGLGPQINITNQTALDPSWLGTVQQVKLTGPYDPVTSYVAAYLVLPGTPGTQAFMTSGYVGDGYVEAYTAAAINAGRNSAITEAKIVKINKECRTDPVFLMWKNQLGGWDYWLFDRIRENEVTAQQGPLVEKYVDYIDRHNIKQQIISAAQTLKMTLGDSVDKQTFEAISGIEGSPQVYMLVDPTMSAVPINLNWIGVRMATKGFKWVNAGSVYEIEISIVLPDNYEIPN